jgi:DNA repair protein RecO (recombination protein O)
MERVQLQPAFILHQRPWRDSSALIEAFTRSHGRIGLVARGIRRPGSKLKIALQPFQPILVSFSGRGDLATLTGAEPSAAPITLAGSRLLCGFYVNELVIRLLYRHDPHVELFEEYQVCLHRLAQAANEEVPLRLFEKRLLAACGYGLNLTEDIDSGEAVEAGRQYGYILERGPRQSGDEPNAALTLAGSSLIALAQEELDDEQSLKETKRLLRAALDLYLGGRPLKTRQVVRDMRRRGSSGLSK